MSDAVTISVLMVCDCEEGEVYGAPAAFAGDVVEVPFSVGARLVAAEYAVVPESEEAEED